MQVLNHQLRITLLVEEKMRSQEFAARNAVAHADADALQGTAQHSSAAHQEVILLVLGRCLPLRDHACEIEVDAVDAVCAADSAWPYVKETAGDWGRRWAILDLLREAWNGLSLRGEIDGWVAPATGE